MEWSEHCRSTVSYSNLSMNTTQLPPTKYRPTNIVRHRHSRVQGTTHEPPHKTLSGTETRGSVPTKEKNGGAEKRAKLAPTRETAAGQKACSSETSLCFESLWISQIKRDKRPRKRNKNRAVSKNEQYDNPTRSQREGNRGWWENNHEQKKNHKDRTGNWYRTSKLDSEKREKERKKKEPEKIEFHHLS